MSSLQHERISALATELRLLAIPDLYDPSRSPADFVQRSHDFVSSADIRADGGDAKRRSKALREQHEKVQE